MNTYILYLFIPALLCKAVTVQARNPFQEMQESFKRMEEMFERNIKQMESLHSSLDIDIEEKKEHALITIKNLETSTVDASQAKEDDNHAANLLVKTDQGTITLQTQENLIALNWQQKKQKDAQSFYGQQALNMTLSRDLDMQSQEIKVHYNEETKTLTITIPFVQENRNTQKREPVPVSFTKKK